MLLHVKKPSQFILSIPSGVDLIEIYESNEKLYSYRELSGEAVIKTNIPHIGEYIIPDFTEILDATAIPIPKLPGLPKADRNRVKKLEIVLDPTLKGTPACIYTESGIIQISEKMLQYPTQIMEFLLYHEKGHTMYSKEEDCDRFALASCLLIGNNASMCYYALRDVLSRSDENIDRCFKLLYAIQETQDERL